MNRTLASVLLGVSAMPALAGTLITEPAAPMIETTASDGFEFARRPITNPTLFDLAVPKTNAHLIAMYHKLPDQVSTTLGQLPMGGHVEIYALQLEWALTERFSLVATKDGYVRIDPDTTPLWSEAEGFANLAGGVKYAFLYDPEKAFAMSGTVTVEAPTGNRDVFQGQGDGSINLIVSGVKMWDCLQVAAAGGASLAFDNQMSDMGFVSAHVSYEVTPWFIPLAEINWHHVLHAGDGDRAFTDQAGGLVPAVAEFEGADLLNFGAANAGENRDLVTAAVGFRSRLCDRVDLGFAYEFPLTDEEDGIIEERWTLDLIWRF